MKRGDSAAIKYTALVQMGLIRSAGAGTAKPNMRGGVRALKTKV
uniref:Uncharacterized protein n=1 Tax=Candidatus Methanogaster sp. ANME-2c ERB4 TaxID=2759911 RepID=A0A7G9YGM2_9EURY|nr:hypothetical protein ANPEMHCN_00035 [Methanosarcinales archaeon ANME-2c ERB4]